MFQGNRRIRKAGERLSLTSKQLSEWRRCLTDQMYFIETYVKIKHVDYEKKVPFIPRFYQREMVEKMMAERFVITKLPRQVGKTAITAAVLLWYLIFNSNFSILIAAHKGDKARDIVGLIKDMFEELPPWLQHGIVEWNKGNIVLENGSRCRASATSGSSARGDTYNVVALDEFAHVPTHVAKAFIMSVIPTISSGQSTKVFITSTPLGMNFFYTMWMAAQEGKNGYHTIEIKWNDVPGRDDKWRDGIVSSFGQQYFDQEYAAEFVGSSYTLITASKLLGLPKISPSEQGEHVSVWKRAEKKRTYVITADVAEGVMGDYSAAVVTDVSVLPYEVVCTYRNNSISTMALPQVLFNLGRSYNEAMIMVDASGIGHDVAAQLHQDLEYENTCMTSSSSRLGAMLGGGFASSSRFGLKIDKRVKTMGCAKLKALVEADQIKINDPVTIEELHRFALIRKTYQAEEGHDDMVMCLVMLAWMADQGYLKDVTSTDARSAVARDNMRRIEDELTPFGMSSNLAALEDEAPQGVKKNDWRWLIGNDADPEPDIDIMESVDRLYPSD